VKLLTYDELPDRCEASRAIVHLAAFGGFPDRRTIEIWRTRTSSFADYVGVFAVDRGTVVGQTFVDRIAYTFPHGTETVAGLAGVATRLDYARAGVARRVLEDVHRREQEAGIEHAILWTNRSWGAHRLYETLGYRDVYEPPWAARQNGSPVRRGLPRGVRAARRSDLEGIEGLHARFGRERWGFAQRPAGFLRAAVAAGELRPKEQILVAHDRGGLSGYAVFESSRSRALCGELVAASNPVRARLASALEARTGARALAFRDGAVDALAPWLRRRGYVTASAGWFGLMGLALGKERARGALQREFGTRDPRFLCFTGDRF
jgi:GNAT superfamily N-acetyltransferase